LFSCNYKLKRQYVQGNSQQVYIFIKRKNIKQLVFENCSTILLPSLNYQRLKN